MKTIQYSVTVLGTMIVPDDLSDERMRNCIEEVYWENEPNDIEWEEIENDV